VLLATEEEPSPTIPTEADPSAEEADLVAADDSHEPAPVDPTPAESPLGPQADPRSFLRDDDFPRWIRDLPALPPRPVPPVTVTPTPAADPADLAAPPDNPVPSLIPLSDPPAVPQEIAQQDLHAVTGTAEPPTPTPSAPVAAAPPDVTPRRREAWETPLLVVLVVGVVAAVIWALLINGLIGSGL
jgi:hypothetical protein